MTEQQVKETFCRDVKKHKMTILHDEGLHRHIMFSIPGSSIYRFYLVTWPGHLCITGDMGTYVFARVKDMFQFFRRWDLSINSGYWHEKMIADSKYVSAREFNKESCIETINKEAGEWDFGSEEERESVKEELDDELSQCEFEGEYYRLGSEFKSSYGHTFSDFWEHNFQTYTVQFLWCLHAIVYGINEYDKVKK